MESLFSGFESRRSPPSFTSEEVFVLDFNDKLMTVAGGFERVVLSGGLTSVLAVFQEGPSPLASQSERLQGDSGLFYGPYLVRCGHVLVFPH
jgi:hypothetical protein